VVPGENTSKAAQRLTKTLVNPTGPDVHDDLAKGQYPSATVREEFHQARRRLDDEARNLPVGAIRPFVRRLLAASLLECLSTQATLLTQLGDHFGTAIQLLDDLLDITEDGINRLPQLTYPAQLTSEGSSLTPIYSQIARELELAMLICQQLPYPSQLSNIFSSTQILMSKLHG